MDDLAEIRRFWPWMRASDWFGPRRAFWSRRYRGVQVVVGRMDAVLFAQSGWAVTFCDDRSRQRSKSDPWDGNQFFAARAHKGPTIAAAMAAAGFGRRLPGIRAIWRRGDALAIKLESSQRPRKKVRLGKRGRRLALAASLGSAWDWSRQRWNDRGEIGG